jgi:hypothetical protein
MLKPRTITVTPDSITPDYLEVGFLDEVIFKKGAPGDFYVGIDRDSLFGTRVVRFTAAQVALRPVIKELKKNEQARYEVFVVLPSHSDVSPSTPRPDSKPGGHGPTTGRGTIVVVGGDGPGDPEDATRSV